LERLIKEKLKNVIKVRAKCYYGIPTTIFGYIKLTFNTKAIPATHIYGLSQKIYYPNGSVEWVSLPPKGIPAMSIWPKWV